jgi:threonine synthase
MRYISTRGQAPALNFEDVLLAGLATDGGLYVPENLPRFTQEEIASWAGLPYHELAFRVMRPFVTGSIPDADFKKILEETYGVFSHNAIAPLRQLNGNEWVLELFHGPTLAFKDFRPATARSPARLRAGKRGERVVIIGATSGDTGSAAIEGCKHCENVDIFILHPHNRVSEVQRRQMTTIFGENIHNIAIEGNFDDCQEMVKASFADQSFLKGTRLVAVNSINWARIMAQIVYYFHASLQLGGPARSVSFSVPTGNFGDIFAGYLARNMGLPINQLIVATNRNDILHRFMSGNQYVKETLHATLSPSMDIMVSSNFERLLFDMHGRNGAALAGLMDSFKQTGNFSVDQKSAGPKPASCSTPWPWTMRTDLRNHRPGLCPDRRSARPAHGHRRASRARMPAQPGYSDGDPRHGAPGEVPGGGAEGRCRQGAGTAAAPG